MELGSLICTHRSGCPVDNLILLWVCTHGPPRGSLSLCAEPRENLLVATRGFLVAQQHRSRIKPFGRIWELRCSQNCIHWFKKCFFNIGHNYHESHCHRKPLRPDTEQDSPKTWALHKTAKIYKNITLNFAAGLLKHTSRPVSSR